MVKSSKFFEVERITGKKKVGSSVQYRVRWKGFGPEEDTWEPARNLKNLQEMLAKFEQIPGSLDTDEVEGVLALAPDKCTCEVKWRARRSGEEPASTWVSTEALRYHSPQALLDFLLV